MAYPSDYCRIKPEHLGVALDPLNAPIVPCAALLILLFCVCGAGGEVSVHRQSQMSSRILIKCSFPCETCVSTPSGR